MTILVTGANGFIGKKIIESLLINESNNSLIGTSIEKESFFKADKFNYICADLSDSNFLDKFKNIDKIDVIIHCGALINYEEHLLNLIKTNCVGMYNIIELMKNKKCKKIIYISSIQVIGKIKQLPIDEKHCTDPLTLYHSTKLFGENYLKNISNIQKFILRISSPVGNGMPNNKILKVFVKNSLEGKPLTLSGKGGRVQNYINIKDIVNAIKICIKDNTHSGIYNIASSENISNIDLAKICIKELNSNSQIIFNGLEDREEKDNWNISIKKAEEELSFKPQYLIRDVIKEIKKEIKNENNVNK